MNGFLINTDSLTQAVTVANAANEEIQQAKDLLNLIAEHQNWVCPERESLNQYTRNNKADIMKIHNKSSQFYSAILKAKEEFLATEKECADHSNDLDTLISELQNIVPGLAEDVSIANNISITDFQDIVGS